MSGEANDVSEAHEAGTGREHPQLPDAAPIRHGRQSPPNPLVGLLKLGGSALAVLVISGLVVTGVAGWQIGSSFKPGIELAAVNPGQAPPEIGAIEGGVNFLLVGSDSGGGNPLYGKRGGAGRNDVTVLVHLSSDHSNATIVSFPRDMLVAIPSCPRPGGGNSSAMASQMLNTAYGHGGVPCVAKTITTLTGLPISYAADVEFDGAVAIADAIGGVDVCLVTPIRDRHTNPPLDLPAGTVTLEGPSAVSFLRTRYGVGDGSDLGRISNQQLFFAALVRQTRDKLSDLPTVYRLATAAASHMELSTNLQNITTMASIALAFKEVDFDKITFVQYPNHYASGGSGGSSRVVPTTATAKILTDAILADLPIALSAGSSGVGATVLDPSVPVVPVAEPPVPSAGAVADSSAPPSAPQPPAAVVLPGGAFGQTAADLTCAAKK